MEYNKPKQRIQPQMPTEELLAGLAEEAAELAKAALKFRRAITQKNPTPVTVDKAWAMLEEEVADTLLCLGVIGVVETVGGASKRCEQITQLKIDRWVNRLGGSVKGAEPGRWVVNRESEDGYKHHMCNKCKTEAPFHYTYVDDYDEGLDGEWFYLGQRESGIVEHLGNYCPNCGVKLEEVKYEPEDEDLGL